METSALIPAAGRGRRFGSDRNKVLCDLAGRPILAHTLETFENCDDVDEIIVVTGKEDIEAVGVIVDRFGFSKVANVVEGGENTRQESVCKGLRHVRGEIVAVHDGARPFVTSDIISRTISEARLSGACVAAVPVVDTIKRASNDMTIVETPVRDGLYSVQTPQTFRTDVLRNAFEKAERDRFTATDDAALVEYSGKEVKIVAGSYDNIKITTRSDMGIANMKTSNSLVCTGMGYDVHRFAEGRKLFLGGVEIDYEMGLLGHSDADVLLHAVSDALLGAASLGDIGRHFPDKDPQYKGISSMNLLARVGEMLREMGLAVVNIDSTVICEQPKISKYVPEMRENIAHALGTKVENINVKGTTTEGLGFTGRGEGIAAQAIANVTQVK